MNKKLDFFATPPTHLTILPQLQASKSKHLIFNSVSKNLKVIVAENIVDICDQKFVLQINVGPIWTGIQQISDRKTFNKNVHWACWKIIGSLYLGMLKMTAAIRLGSM